MKNKYCPINHDLMTDNFVCAMCKALDRQREDVEKEILKFDIDYWLTDMGADGTHAHTDEDLEDWLCDFRSDLIKSLKGGGQDSIR